MLDMVNGTLGFNSHLFEPNPNENGATDMISDNSCFATLISFDAGQLLGFSEIATATFFTSDHHVQIRATFLMPGADNHIFYMRNRKR
jgi:hypothetical protein